MTDQNGPGGATLEIAVGRVLRLGIRATTVCLSVGLALAMLGVAIDLTGTLLTVGLVLLLATPAARVVVSIADYARERDWLFLAFTLVVLLELAGSVIVALSGVGS